MGYLEGTVFYVRELAGEMAFFPQGLMVSVKEISMPS